MYEEHLRQIEQPHPPIMMPADSDEGLETAARRREMDFDLLQKEGLSIIGDPDYVTREIQAQMRELGPA